MNLVINCRRSFGNSTPREEKAIQNAFQTWKTRFEHFEEVGQHFAVTRERIRQIEAKALRKLRHPSRSRKLKAFFEGKQNNLSDFRFAICDCKDCKSPFILLILPYH